MLSSDLFGTAQLANVKKVKREVDDEAVEEVSGGWVLFQDRELLAAKISIHDSSRSWLAGRKTFPMVPNWTFRPSVLYVIPQNWCFYATL